jgi:hypothetical protein
MTVENHQTVQPWLTRSGSQVIHIHRNMPIDLDEVVNIFSTKHPRRLELWSLAMFWLTSLVNEATYSYHVKVEIKIQYQH